MRGHNKSVVTLLVICICCWIVCICFCVSGVFTLKENTPLFIYIVGGIVLGLAVAASTAVLLQETLVYRIRMRREALKALGRHGIGVVFKDKTARLAYDGIYEFMRGRYPKAEELLIKSLHLSSVRNNQLFCVEWLAKLYEATGNDSKVIWCHRKAVEYAPDNPEYQARLGHDYYVEGSFDKAWHCFTQAVNYDPNHGFSRYSLAKICAVRGEDERAVRMLLELLEIKQNHPLVYSELATLYAIHGDDDKCKEYYHKALMCGYDEPKKLSDRMTAIYDFNHAKNVDGSSLPQEYYRHIEKKEDKDAGNE